MKITKHLENIPVICDNMFCEARGEIARCYLGEGEGDYRFCRRYMLYRNFADRHKRKQKRKV